MSMSLECHNRHDAIEGRNTQGPKSVAGKEVWKKQTRVGKISGRETACRSNTKVTRPTVLEGGVIDRDQDVFIVGQAPSTIHGHSSERIAEPQRRNVKPSDSRRMSMKLRVSPVMDSWRGERGSFGGGFGSLDRGRHSHYSLSPLSTFFNRMPRVRM